MPRATYCDAVDWSLLRVKQTPSGRGESVVLDPQRHFATVNCRNAKVSFDYFVGSAAQPTHREPSFERYSNAKMRFQSFFMLITVQPFFFASS
jgi:hypothetical protein